MTLIVTLPLKTTEKRPAEREAHRIVMAAVKFGDLVYAGWRHSDVIMHVHALGKGYTTQEDQGFIDNYGYFHSRYTACKIAAGCRQLQVHSVRDIMSEQLWDKHGTPRVPGEPYQPGS